MRIAWDPARVSLTSGRASDLLRSSDQPIAISGGDEQHGLTMASFMLQPGEDQIVAERLVRLFREHSHQV